MIEASVDAAPVAPPARTPTGLRDVSGSGPAKPGDGAVTDAGGTTAVSDGSPPANTDERRLPAAAP